MPAASIRRKGLPRHALRQLRGYRLGDYERSPVTKVKTNKPKPKVVQRLTIQSPHVEPDNSGSLSHIGGSKSNDWNRVLVDQAFGSLWCGNSDEEYKGKQCNATVAFMVRTKPADELEGMMAAQLFAAHNAAMECYRRAMIKDQPAEGRALNLNQANKLSRTYTTLLDALNRYRGKGGQQKVTVEHVHVYDGGQAAIGNLNARGGGGVPSNLGEQPFGTDAATPEPALLCEDPIGNILPIASNAERQMSPTRRKEPRRA